MNTTPLLTVFSIRNKSYYYLQTVISKIPTTIRIQEKTAYQQQRRPLQTKAEKQSATDDIINIYIS